MPASLRWEKKVDSRADQTDQKVDLTREFLLAEMKAMKASIDVNTAKLTPLPRPGTARGQN